MSRELYDLCRRYKHFYNKHEDVKKWHQKYHDLDLSDFIGQTKVQLMVVEDELMNQLLKDWKVDVTEIHMSNDIPMTGFGRMAKCVKSSDSEIQIHNSRRFVGALGKYVSWYHGNNWRM